MTTFTPRPPLRAVVDAVAQAFELEARQLTGSSRNAHIVAARHAAMLVLRQAYGLSLAAIGALLGGRDHTTIRYGVAAAATRYRHDSGYAARIRALMPQEDTPVSYLLEREAERLVASLRALARDARRPLEAAEDPAEILSGLAAKLEAAAGGLEHELAALAQARQHDVARTRAADPAARLYTK